MIWFFASMAIIQIGLWIYFIIKKKYAILIVSGFLGVFSIWSFVDAYIKYIYFDPCEGIDGCMNETGMIFVLLIFLMFLSTFISLIAFVLDFYKNKKHI